MLYKERPTWNRGIESRSLSKRLFRKVISRVPIAFWLDLLASSDHLCHLAKDAIASISIYCQSGRNGKHSCFRSAIQLSLCLLGKKPGYVTVSGFAWFNCGQRARTTMPSLFLADVVHNLDVGQRTTAVANEALLHAGTAWIHDRTAVGFHVCMGGRGVMA